MLAARLPEAQAPQRRKIALRRRASAIRALRIVLPSIAGLTLVGVLGTAVRGVQQGENRRAALGSAEMTAPRLVGADGKGRSFAITAKTANRDPASPERVQLVSPVLVRDGQGAEQLRVVAANGVYDETVGKLFLSGGVAMSNAQGQSQAASTVFDVKSGQLVGAGSIRTTTTFGEVRAGSVTADVKSKSVIYRGRVQSRINTK